MDSIKKQFKNPSSEYRSAPFWSWNDVMDPEELARQIRDFKAHGMGGAFAHPREGMVTEYLSEDFFKAWKGTLDAVKEEDMKLYIYDENTWPTGMAGGRIVEMDPSTTSTLAKFRIIRADEPSAFNGVVIYAAEYKDGVLGAELTAYPKEKWKDVTDGEVAVAYYYRTFSDGKWHGNCPMADLSNPRSTELLIETTYDEYYKRFGEDFGKYIPAAFSDEAFINSDGRNTMPYSEHLREKFRLLNGYDLTPQMLPALFNDIKGLKTDKTGDKIRNDYMYTIHELWIDNFVKPIAKWCEDHGIAWTGHDCEHNWPLSNGGRLCPSEQTTYEFRQWPGFDLLLCDHLINEPANFDKFQMFEVRSAANQFGHKRTICEAYGAGGYQSTLADYKRLGDYIMVDGINLLCQHLSLYSYLGSAKRDCPQSFDYRQPWWEEYTDMANYFARTSYLLSQGKMEQRLLLLNPSTTSYIVPSELQDGGFDHETEVDCIKNPDMSDMLTIINELTDNQWDFDLGDEFSISRHGKVEDGLFKVGNMAYETVIISQSMANMRRDTVRLVCEFAAAGGNVVTTDGALVNVAKFIEGDVNCPETDALRAACDKVDGAEKLCEYLKTKHAERITSSTPWVRGVQHMRRVLDDGRVVYFFVNHAMGDFFETDITVDGDCAAKWDLYTGDTCGIPVKAENGKITFHLKLERCASALIVVGDDAPVCEALPEATEKVSLEAVSIEAEAENMITLDHVTVDGPIDDTPRYVLDARHKMFRAMGFTEDTPWKGIQRKNDWMDANVRFDESTAFSVNYSFTVEEGVLPTKLIAVVERPELWHVLVNGVEISCLGKDPLDIGMGQFDISAAVKEGDNTLTLHADKFNVLCELESVYIRGDFSVNVKGDKFVIAKKDPITMGNWVEQGLRFYKDAVKYAYKANLDKAPASAKVTLGGHGATVVSVTVNGEYAGFIGMDGGVSLEIGKYLKAGENDIVFRVCGSFRNLLGPHVEERPFEPYAWYWTEDYVTPAKDYIFTEYGLFDEPVLTIG